MIMTVSRVYVKRVYTTYTKYHYMDHEREVDEPLDSIMLQRLFHFANKLLHLFSNSFRFKLMQIMTTVKFDQFSVA